MGSFSAGSHPGFHLNFTGDSGPAAAYLAPAVELGDGERQTIFERAWVRLVEEEFPDGLILPAVEGLGYEYPFCDKVWPASWWFLVKHFPQLSSLDLRAFDMDLKALESRSEARNGRLSPLNYALSLPLLIRHGEILT